MDTLKNMYSPKVDQNSLGKKSFEKFRKGSSLI